MREVVSNEQLLIELKEHPHVQAAVMNADDLVVRIGGEIVRFASDREQGRTACWTQVQLLSPGDIKPAASAARRYNSSVKEITRLTMGLFVEGNTLILGRSVDKLQLTAAEVVGLAAEISAGAAGARASVEQMLEECRAAEKQAMIPSLDLLIVHA